VIVVEHDEDAIRQADYVVDIGPGAGVHGGSIVAEGTPKQVIAGSRVVTGRTCPASMASRCRSSGARPIRRKCW
jgi:excinuclease UvrABC ATPase subunit